tara:strand:- start:1164 stop:3320 length:2157 start_codon:yes stop_codon:yes gene_type:complete
MSFENEQLETYKEKYLDTLTMRRDFSFKPGYIREKSPEELALQNAKKVFGEFNPSNEKAMERNTNDGQGVSVSLPNGEKQQFDNQLELYRQVVKYNKEYGGFYDLSHIAKTNEEDHDRLHTTNDALNKAKKDYLSQFGKDDKRTAYQTLSKAEKEIRSEFHKKNDKSSNKEKPVTSKPKQPALNEALDDPLEARSDDAQLFDEKDDNIASLPLESDSKSKSPLNDLFSDFIRVPKLASDAYYWRSQTGIEAFRDKGSKLSTKSSSEKIVTSLVALAKEKGWDSLKVSGTKEFKSSVWMEASLAGIDVKGYRPTPQELTLLDEKRKLLGLDVEQTKEANTIENEKPSETVQPDSTTPTPQAKDTAEAVINTEKSELNSPPNNRVFSEIEQRRILAQNKVSDLIVDNLKADGQNSVEFGGETNSPLNLRELAQQAVSNKLNDLNINSEAHAEPFDLKTDGNTLSFMDNGKPYEIDVQDPTGFHGAANALRSLTARNHPFDNASSLIDSLKQLSAETGGQFEVNLDNVKSLVESEEKDNQATNLSELSANATNIELKAEGNTLSFKDNDQLLEANIYDPTGEHGAENALDAMKSLYEPITTAEALRENLNKLEIDTQGQFQVNNITNKQATEMSLAEKMESAFDNLRRSEAIAQYPQLEGVYKVKYAASTFANKSIAGDQNKERFVDSVKSQAINLVASGKQLNTEKIAVKDKPTEQEVEL